VRHALHSIVRQGYANIEVIVLDDQSSDDTYKLVKEWAATAEVKLRFRRVLVTQNETNLGAHESINQGISLAQGEFVTILNSDDAYAPHRIESLVAMAEQTGAELLFSGVRVIDDNGEWMIRPGLAAELESAADLASSYPSVSFAILKKNVAGSTGNLFFTRRLFDKVGPFRPFKYCHDWDFMLRACLVTEPVIVQEALYDYRIHESNSYSNLRVEKYLEPIAIYDHYFANCRAGNCTNPMAPWHENWPELFAKLAQDDAQLSWVAQTFAKSDAKLGGMAGMLRSVVRQAT